MRIISGIHRGRRIESLKNKTLRPTLGKAREAMFNILTHGRYQNLLPGAKVLDLFCGCASFSMEALSRGADHVVCIDINPEHLAVAKHNISKIDALDQATFLRADSTRPPHATFPCNIAFLDPPYNAGLAYKALTNAIAQGWLTDDAIVIVETDIKEKFQIPEYFSEVDNRHYGKSNIRILERKIPS